MQTLMPSGYPFLLLRCSFVRLGQEARTFDPIRLRTKQAFIHRYTMVVILRHLPQHRCFLCIELSIFF